MSLFFPVTYTGEALQTVLRAKQLYDELGLSRPSLDERHAQLRRDVAKYRAELGESPSRGGGWVPEHTPRGTYFVPSSHASAGAHYRHKAIMHGAGGVSQDVESAWRDYFRATGQMR